MMWRLVTVVSAGLNQVGSYGCTWRGKFRIRAVSAIGCFNLAACLEDRLLGTGTIDPCSSDIAVASEISLLDGSDVFGATAPAVLFIVGASRRPNE
jgi:hypothetical protein